MIIAWFNIVKICRLRYHDGKYKVEVLRNLDTHTRFISGLSMIKEYLILITFNH